MSIQRLPEDVIGQIKSSIFDSRATKINVSVDYARGNCSVEDNGLGIPPTEFRPDGGLGKLHCMSAPLPSHSQVTSSDG